jgi:uncharacterized sporulation protein YeaH/YhbH (DUF444 family)
MSDHLRGYVGYVIAESVIPVAYMKSLKIPKGGNQNPYIEEEHNGQKKKIQKDKQRSTKHTYKAKDRVRRTPLKTGVNSGAPEG